MAKNRKSSLAGAVEIPDLGEALRGVLHSEDELQYGLRGVVRILSNRGRNGKNGYFFEGFKVVFGSEINEEVSHEETFLDYENLKIIVKLPDPKDSKSKEIIRHQYTKHYTLGADDLKTRAAMVAFAGLDDSTKETLVASEKKLDQKNKI
ncbi:MAG: hypothetical protein HUU57_15715 [Bdellovibrio sp.]|nr:hypothetical protein [Bdellovibrio sp.]